MFFYRVDDIICLCLRRSSSSLPWVGVSGLLSLSLNLTWVTNQSYRSVVLTLPRVPFLRQGYDHWLHPFLWPLLSCPDLETPDGKRLPFLLPAPFDQLRWDVVHPRRFTSLQVRNRPLDLILKYLQTFWVFVRFLEDVRNRRQRKVIKLNARAECVALHPYGEDVLRYRSDCLLQLFVKHFHFVLPPERRWERKPDHCKQVMSTPVWRSVSLERHRP